MKIEIIKKARQFDDLKDEWVKLQSQGAVKDITLTWEWMRTWWEVFKNRRNLSVLVATENGEVIGIAPFIQRDFKYFNLFNFKRIEFLASGEDERDEICSDYLDFIISPGSEKEFLETIFEYINRSDHISWDEILISRMKTDSPVFLSLYELADSYGLKIDETSRSICTYALLPTSLDEYISQLGRRTRKQIRRDMNRLNELGKVTYKVAQIKEDIETMKEVFIKLHQSRWTQDGKPGVFSSEKFKKFHDDMMLIAHQNDWLRLGTLYLDEKPLACEYNFKFGEKIYSYQCGVNIFEDWNLSIGTIADVYSIGNAISEGIKEYDFLEGATDYKRRLGKNTREIVTIRISRASIKESMFKTIFKIKDYTRRCFSVKRNDE